MLDRMLFSTWDIEPKRLAVFRMIYGLFALMWIFPVSFWVHDLPGSWFEPAFGPLLVFESTPASWVMVMLSVVAAFSLVGVVAGFGTRWMSLAAAVALATLSGIEYSFGKIDHTTFMWLVPALMSFSAWGDEISVDAIRSKGQSSDESRPGRQAWPVALLVVALASAMATAAVAKIRGGWLDLSYSATRGHQVSRVFTLGGDKLLAVPAAENHLGFFDEVFDWATVGFEGAFLPALFSRKWTRRIVAIAMIFHLAVVLMLNIAFLANLAVYGAVVAWPTPGSKQSQRRLLIAATAFAVVSAVFASFGHPLARVAFSWAQDGDLWVSALIIAIGAAAAARWLLGDLVCAVQTVIGRRAHR